MYPTNKIPIQPQNIRNTYWHQYSVGDIQGIPGSTLDATLVEEWGSQEIKPAPLDKTKRHRHMIIKANQSTQEIKLRQVNENWHQQVKCTDSERRLPRESAHQTFCSSGAVCHSSVRLNAPWCFDIRGYICSQFQCQKPAHGNIHRPCKKSIQGIALKSQSPPKGACCSVSGQLSVATQRPSWVGPFEKIPSN